MKFRLLDNRYKNTDSLSINKKSFREAIGYFYRDRPGRRSSSEASRGPGAP